MLQQMQPPHAGVHNPPTCGVSGAPVSVRRLRLQRHRYHRLCKPVASQGDGEKGGGSSKDDQAINKPAGADFSAYWSNKVRSFFSQRRAYLDAAESAAGGKEPESLKRLNESIEQQQQALSQAQQAERDARLAQAGPLLDADQKASEKARNLLSPLGRLLFPQGVPDVKPLAPEDQAELDIQRARAYLQSPQAKGVGLTYHRVSKILRDTLMLPFTLCAVAWKAWHETFQSQRYEMFLMAEGERIWYWRNRTENERWFWDIFAWDRLIFPIICTVAYQYIVPNNLIWVVVVPMVFIMWQSGRVPGPFNLEFWLIAYFGVYKKCWGDILWAARALFQWA
ncbi:hypothetical protein DUNSADRAFT_16071 [Dunaliella salina]|uniref:Uncharacterized protein n=1 Tax=Dunaliella salina TaxID=3046 RepID=A0ABQ7G4B6_DUNSA|nr:hypothetical protein DUNSADRAFT_16071 [Dunaliella salina]|eukprot:KAF5829447.1 hypothetical protein DUNSADRAFT_16071 [Dunaliella salina]